MRVLPVQHNVPAAARANGKHLMAPGPMAPRAVLQDEGFRIFTLGTDVLAVGEHFKAKLDAFAVGSAGRVKKARDHH